MERLRSKAQWKPSEITTDDFVSSEVQRINSDVGELKGMNCPLCRNKGYIAVEDEGEVRIMQCKCLKARRSIELLERSGVNSDYTLQNFRTDQPWQKALLEKAKQFVEKQSGWMFIGGQVGCGKTHLCTGIVIELLHRLRPARYMLWRDESTTIKASIKYPEEYAALIEPLKTVDVLYIDDFLKTNSGQPTTADCNLAFEILNARHNRKGLVTILSSEFLLPEIIQMDEGLGSRIFQKAKGFVFNIRRDVQKNQRLKISDENSF